MMRFISGLAGFALLGGVTMPSFATAITQGGSSVVPSTIATFSGFNTLAMTPSMPYSIGGTDTGFVGESAGTWTGNPFGPNDLTFVYQVYVSTGSIAQLSGSPYGGFSLDVEQYQDSGTTAASNAIFTSGGAIEFNFANDLTPTEESYFLIVSTNAPFYNSGPIGLVNAPGVPTSDPGYAPSTSPIPEPSTLSLLGTGILGIGAGLRRRALRK